MSAAGGWMEGLAPLIQNLSNIAGTGDRAREAALWDDYNFSMRKASNIPAAEMASRVAGAKAAGLHPLAALGVNVGSYNSPVVASQTEGLGHAMGSYSRNNNPNADLERRLMEAQVKTAEADASIAQQKASEFRVASQPGQPPYVDLQPAKVIRTKPGTPHVTEGFNPSEDKFAALDVYGHPITVNMPSEKYGQVLENLGEVNAAILGAPYTARALAAQYLQYPLTIAPQLYNTGVRGRKDFKPSKFSKRFIERR